MNLTVIQFNYNNFLGGENIGPLPTPSLSGTFQAYFILVHIQNTGSMCQTSFCLSFSTLTGETEEPSHSNS